MVSRSSCQHYLCVHNSNSVQGFSNRMFTMVTWHAEVVQMETDAPAARMFQAHRHWELQTNQPTSTCKNTLQSHVWFLFYYSLYRYHLMIIYFSWINLFLWKHHYISWMSWNCPPDNLFFSLSSVLVLWDLFSHDWWEITDVLFLLLSRCMFTCDLDHVCGLPWGRWHKHGPLMDYSRWILEKLSCATQGFVFRPSLFMLLGF